MAKANCRKRQQVRTYAINLTIDLKFQRLKTSANLNFRQIKRKKCVRKVNPTPESLHPSILGDDCALGAHSIAMFCGKYMDFLNWTFSGCSHPNKDKNNVKLTKRCNKIMTYY